MASSKTVASTSAASASDANGSKTSAQHSDSPVQRATNVSATASPTANDDSVDDVDTSDVVNDVLVDENDGAASAPSTSASFCLAYWMKSRRPWDCWMFVDIER